MSDIQMRPLRLIRHAVLATAVLMTGSPPAIAAESAASSGDASNGVVALASDKAVLSKGPAGAWSTKVKITNLTPRPLAVEAKPSSGDPCTFTVDGAARGKLEPQVTATLPVALGPSCKPAGEPPVIGFTLVVSGAEEPLVFPVSAAAKAPGSEANWDYLLAFAVALIVMGLLVLGTTLVTADISGVSTKLPYLEDGWTFKESWATNVTAGGSILVGVLASTDVLKVLLGDDADGVTALVATGTAISLGFAGAGGLVAAAGVTKEGNPTICGFSGGAAFTLAGVAGQIALITLIAWDLLGGVTQTIATVAAAVSLAIVLVYAVRTVATTLEVGQTMPPDAPDAPTFGRCLIV